MEFILKYFTGTIIKENLSEIALQVPEQNRKNYVCFNFSHPESERCSITG